ncbi:Homeodomain-containing transcription factor [Encephalitozoon intestinalis ATCC 50506]|uniref:Homeodomain-containing transcription factor n=1 Tax=Encephalitozoon intestinalis (strain ATCC 50506) TaxID=876142 RepID=E0S8V7_ENCIT|nr:Homeodomain-containing transcription factor [Encephalitozoon intestinalis ATCC 50506]ADM12223.1 Homeodomain-containing transcription factor [Encephalitozoon intestinalis ATCC 50506]UTX46032.1 homeodomain-containing protein [Encephalitozoon intestinalis]
MKDSRWMMEGEAILGLIKLRRLSDKSYLGLSGYKYKTRVQVYVLKQVFEITPYPPHDTRQNLAILLNMSPRTIQIWFQNSRSVSKDLKKDNSSKDQESQRPSRIKIVSNWNVPIKYILWLVLSYISYPQIGN